MAQDHSDQAKASGASSSDHIARLERALALAAYIVLRHGPAYAPYIDRLEQELEAARKDDPAVRARRILDSYVGSAGPKSLPAPPGDRAPL